MNLLDLLKTANGGQNVETIASQFGLSPEQTSSVLGQVLPALTQGLKNNISQPGGIESLIGALSSGHHSQYIDQPETLAQPVAREEGNGILGHLLGSKDASRELARQVSGSTGVSDSLIKQMLPVVASLAMGAIAKQRNTGSADSPLGGIASMLDFNRDGNVADDVMGVVGKLFGR